MKFKQISSEEVEKIDNQKELERYKSNLEKRKSERKILRQAGIIPGLSRGRIYPHVLT